MKKLRPYFLFILVILEDLIIFLLKPQLGIQIFSNTLRNYKEMLGIIPPIFLLLGLMDVWIPRETIIKFLGEKSGLTGVFLSMLMGAAAAGPLYGAFPIAGMMLNKGAKYSNILIFLGAWSTLKIPMFLFEVSALGPRFAVTRWIVNFVGIIGMTLIIDKAITEEEKEKIYLQHRSAP